MLPGTTLAWTHNMLPGTTLPWVQDARQYFEKQEAYTTCINRNWYAILYIEIFSCIKSPKHFELCKTLSKKRSTFDMDKICIEFLLSFEIGSLSLELAKAGPKLVHVRFPGQRSVRRYCASASLIKIFSTPINMNSITLNLMRFFIIEISLTIHNELVWYIHASERFFSSIMNQK